MEQYGNRLISNAPFSIDILQRVLVETFGELRAEAVNNQPLFYHGIRDFGGGSLIVGEGIPHIVRRTRSDMSDERMSIFIVEQGRVHIRHAGRSYDLEEGQLALLDQRHSLTIEHVTGYHIKSLLIPKRYIPLITSQHMSCLNRPITSNYGPARILKTLVSDLSEISDTFSDMEKVSHWNSICRIIAYVLQEFLGEDGRTVEENSIVSKAQAFIQDQYANADLSQHEIADFAGVSLRTLNRSLAQDGTSLANLIMQTRINQARRLLRIPGREAIPIATIAYEVGFKDPAHFSRVFKKGVGMTPGQWRQLEIM